MDPDANLIEQRRIAARILTLQDSADDAGVLTLQAQTELVQLSERAAELITGLDQWLSAGGFLPAPWQKGRTS